MIEGSKYAMTVEGRRIYVALETLCCDGCTTTILRGDLFTRGLPGDPTAKVCHECRPFEVEEQEVVATWRHATRHDYYLNI